jgi:hypothetical protein
VDLVIGVENEWKLKGEDRCGLGYDPKLLSLIDKDLFLSSYQKKICSFHKKDVDLVIIQNYFLLLINICSFHKKDVDLVN